MNPDWFEEAADAAADTAKAKRVASSQAAVQATKEWEAKKEEARQLLLKRGNSPAARAANDVFDAVAAGAIPAHLPNPALASAGRGGAFDPAKMADAWANTNTSTPVSRRITADEGLAAIIRTVKESGDPYVAAGEWMTKVTRALAEVAADEMDDELKDYR